jgi:hypothetical protein
VGLLARRAGCYRPGSNLDSADAGIVHDGTNIMGIDTIRVYDGIVAIHIYHSAITVHACDGGVIIGRSANSPANSDSLGRSG